MDTAKFEKDLISIVVPVYQVEEYLPICIESIIAQTYSKWELILVDDGTKDSSGIICDEYARKDFRITVIHQQNQGVSVARNAGLERIKGEYLAFIDADDYIKPDYLEILHRDLVEQNADIVCCATVQPDGNKNVRVMKPFVKESRLISDAQTIYADIAAEKELYWASIWGKLCKSSLAIQCRFFPMRYAEDTRFMFDLFLLNPVVYLDAYEGYYYILRENSAVASALQYDVTRQKCSLEEKYYILKKLPPVLPEVYNTFVYNYALRIHALAYAAVVQKVWKEHSGMLMHHAQEALSKGNKLPQELKRNLKLIANMSVIYRLLVQIKHIYNTKLSQS